jgi:hypothetical protein
VVFDESGRIRRKFVDLVSGETTVLDFADDGGSGIDGH